MQQIYIKTSETLIAEKKILEHIKGAPFPLERKIGERYFNTLLKKISKDQQAHCIKNGIPFKYSVNGGFVEYTLRAK